MPEPKGVNDVERVELEPSESEEDEEVITTPEDIKEKETPSESPSEEKPKDATEEEEETEEEKTKKEELVRHKVSPASEEDKGVLGSEEEIKHLPEETPREYALRLEVTRLRRENKSKRAKELLREQKPTTMSQVQYNELNEEDKNILAQYDSTELNTFEKILSVLAKKHGWVQKEQLQTTRRNEIASDVLDEFLNNHPEYSSENDKDDILWNRFKIVFTSGLYNTNPSNPKQLKTIFNSIHRDIFGIHSDLELKKINAQREKLKVSSHSGSSASRGLSSTPSGTLTPEQKSHLKGFSKKDFEELGL